MGETYKSVLELILDVARISRVSALRVGAPQYFIEEDPVYVICGIPLCVCTHFCLYGCLRDLGVVRAYVSNKFNVRVGPEFRNASLVVGVWL